jgi:hypothetical protein
MIKTEKVKISLVKSNPNNPRIIKDDKFKQLVKSIKEFPEMLEIRPIVVNSDMIVLGGNMRLKACVEAGLKQVPIIKASTLTPDQQRQFIIKDNSGYGEWDWELIRKEWNLNEIGEWGIEIPPFIANGELLNLEPENNAQGDYGAGPGNSKTSNDYSLFELVMLHTNKLKLVEILNHIKAEDKLETLEQAMMSLIKSYDK